jgi:hypothetical protein
MMNMEMTEKIADYELKIKSLYEQLIKAKRERYGIKVEERIDLDDQIILTTLNS